MLWRQTRFGSARLLLPRRGGKPRTEARSVRPASRRPPAQDLLLSREMDGFAGSLGESRPPLVHALLPLTCLPAAGQRKSHAPLAALHVSLLFLCAPPHWRVLVLKTERSCSNKPRSGARFGVLGPHDSDLQNKGLRVGLFGARACPCVFQEVV